jgi:hypothetical protein
MQQCQITFPVPIFLCNIASIPFLITTLIMTLICQVLLLLKVKSNHSDDKVDLKGLGSESDGDVLLRCHDDEIIHLDCVNNDSYGDNIDSHSLESDK